MRSNALLLPNLTVTLILTKRDQDYHQSLMVFFRGLYHFPQNFVKNWLSAFSTILLTN